MAATDAQSLYAIAQCYQCGGTVGQVQLLKLGLLVQIVKQLNPMAATDPQSLLNVAACYDCGSNASMGDLFELALLRMIVANDPNVLSGVGNPTGVIFPTVPVAIYFDTASSIQYNWFNGAWH